MSTPHVRICFSALVGAFASPHLGFADAPYDVVIRHGKVVDGTANPWKYADVAVRGDRIVAIGPALTGSATKEIDAAGLVVAPGFIDMHSHSDFTVLEDGTAQSKVRQGVTTDVVGEGGSAGPNLGLAPPKTARVAGQEVKIVRLRDYYDALDKAGVSINIASYVGVDNLWRGVVGQSHRMPTLAEREKMKGWMEEAMKDGAFGLSSQLISPPGSLIPVDVLIELSKVVARHGGIYSTHNRNEGDGIIAAVKEAIAIGERAQVPVDIIHIKIADQKMWRHMNEVVALIDDARKRGVNVQANVYPYTRGNNNLSSIIPPWAVEGGRDATLARLRDPKLRGRLKQEIRDGIPGWYDHYTAVGRDWSRMLLNAGRYGGMTLDKVIAERSKGITPTPDALDVFLDFLIESGGAVGTIYAHHTEEDMTLVMAQPWCSIGSDGSAISVEGAAGTTPHPRSFGTFPRVLGVYVRDQGLLRLEEAVRKMTSLNAAKIGLRDRGVLRQGAFADITVFDPARVIDKSTYLKPLQYSEGITHVMVNGKLVIDKGQHTGARPGRALRHGL